jgi:hypothetical protein
MMEDELLTVNFSSQTELDSYLKDYQKTKNIGLRRRTSHKNSDLESSTIFPFDRQRYECLHYGKPRHNVVDGSRPGQKTNALDCKYHFEFSLVKDDDNRKLTVKAGHVLTHNHATSQSIGANYVRNRAMSSEEIEFCVNLLRVK